MAWTEQTLQRKSEEFQTIANNYLFMSSDEIAREYTKLYVELDFEERRIAPLKRKLEVVKALLAEKFAEEEKKSVKFDNGSSVSVRFTTPFSVQDKPAFIQWLKNNDLESELTVSAARCSTIAKNLYEETQKIPDGLVAGDPVPVVTFRK